MDLSEPPSTDSEPFTKACECVWKKLTDNEKRNFSKWITIADVYNEVKEIQHKQAETKTLRNLQKIRPYVDLLGKYSSVIEVFVQAKPDVLALIWVRMPFRQMMTYF